MDGASASWSPYGKGNCTITITSDVVERNGDWQVMFKLNNVLCGRYISKYKYLNLTLDFVL